jgi:hypothetical protein
MGFWDFTDDPYGWLTSRVGKKKIAGSPHATRTGLSRGKGNDPFSTISDILDRDTGSGGSGRVYGHFNDQGMGPYRRQQSQHIRSGAQGLLDQLNAPPSTADILAQLQSLQDPSRYMSDQGSLAQQAMSLVSSQYDPLIAELESQMSGAQNRANRNNVRLGDLYGDLSTSIGQDVPVIEQQYSQDKAQSQQMYDQLQQQTKSTYDQTQQDQQQMMQQLNIQAAAPDVMAAQNRDRDYFTQLAAQNSATQQSALSQEERGAVNYTRQGSENARLEGANRQSDLMAQLQDLLAQYSGQIGAQKASKNSAYLSTLGELTSQSQDSAYQRAQRDFDNYISEIQLGRVLNKDSQSGQASVVKSPADVAGRVLGMGLNQKSAQNIQNVFMSVLSSDPEILSGQSIFGQSAPKEAMAQRVVEAGRKAGMSSAELNALQTVALEYFGRR